MKKCTTDFIHAELKIYPMKPPCCALSGEKNPNFCRKEKEGLPSSGDANGSSTVTCLFVCF